MLDGAENIPVEKPIQVARQPALDAHFGCAALARLARPANDFLERKRVGVRRARPAAKAAKTAADIANVCEIDVPIDDVSDHVADRLSSQLVLHCDKRVQIGALGRAQPQAFLEAESFSASRLLQNVANFGFAIFQSAGWRGRFVPARNILGRSQRKNHNCYVAWPIGGASQVSALSPNAILLALLRSFQHRLPIVLCLSAAQISALASR